MRTEEFRRQLRSSVPRPAALPELRVPKRRAPTISLLVFVLAAGVLAFRVTPRSTNSTDVVSAGGSGWAAVVASPVAPSAGVSLLATPEWVFIWAPRDAATREARASGFMLERATGTWKPIGAAPLTLTWTTVGWTGRELLLWGVDDVVTGPTKARPNGAVFEPRARTWRVLPTNPEIEPGPAITGSGETIMLGERSAARLDLEAFQWRATPAPPLPLLGGLSTTAAGWDGPTFVVSATASPAPLVYDSAGSSWSKRAASPTGERRLTQGVWDGRHLVELRRAEGVADQLEWLPSFASYDHRSDSWRPVPPPPAQVTNWDPTVARQRVVLRCGAELCELDAASATWTSLPSPPEDSILAGTDRELLALSVRSDGTGVLMRFDEKG